MPRTDRDDFLGLVDHAMKAASATTRLLSDQAWTKPSSCCGAQAGASCAPWRRFLRTWLATAHEREQSFVDDAVLTAAIDDLALTRPSAATLPSTTPEPPTKPRGQTRDKITQINRAGTDDSNCPDGQTCFPVDAPGDAPLECVAELGLCMFP